MPDPEMRATMLLRFVKREDKLILQQYFEEVWRDKGEWRDVKTVEEEG
jgi:hypothetical protein